MQAAQESVIESGCSECRSTASPLRRGLCRACYLRAWRGTALPKAAKCALCPERRKIVLRWTRLGTSRVVTCQNCGFLADRARPKPSTLAELQARFDRERRAQDRRCNYVIDTASADERRRHAPRRRKRAASR